MSTASNDESTKLDFKLTPNRYTYLFAAAGVMGAISYNGFMRRILWQGIYRHIGSGMLGAYIGTKYGQWGDYNHAKRDYIINEYIARHPEDFKKPPVKLVGERFDNWTPIR